MAKRSFDEQRQWKAQRRLRIAYTGYGIAQHCVAAYRDGIEMNREATSWLSKEEQRQCDETLSIGKVVIC